MVLAYRWLRCIRHTGVFIYLHAIKTALYPTFVCSGFFAEFITVKMGPTNQATRLVI
jgi:hypothetical protein